MKQESIMRIFEDTAFVRMGGRESERQAADYLCNYIHDMGMEAYLESFDVPMGDLEESELLADGVSIPCIGYMCAGSSEIEAPFYYLRSNDAWSLSRCKGKIVMIDGYLGYWVYQDLLKYGAVGFITHSGNVNYTDREVDARELRGFVHNGNIIPGVNINSKDAVELIKKGTATVSIKLKQKEYTGNSQNVILDMPGEIDEYLVFTAHYDSTSLSQGAYDNMSGSVGLLGIAQYFTLHPHRRGLRFIWCGCEERGLLGSKAYCLAHKDELDKVVLNINLDMIGCIMGKFISCVTAEEKLVGYIEYFASEYGWGIKVSQDVYSSDSTPFADSGVPAVSFARIAPSNTATIHNSYDTIALMSGAQMAEDIDFLNAFASRIANAAKCPIAHEMPDNMKEKLDFYLNRKRAPGK